MSLTRAKFEQLVDPLVERCRGPVLKALKDAELQAGDIDEVVLVGGMTRMPQVQQLVKEIFGKEGHKGVNPDEVVAIGAAIQGAQLLLGSKSDVLLLDVTPLSLGIETLGGVHDQADRAQHDDPDDEEGDLLDGGGQPDGRDGQRLPGRERRWPQPDNRLLGQFNLEGIPPAPRGVPQIEVTFDIDANGILQRVGQGHGHGQGAEDPHRELERPRARRRSSGCARRRRRTPTRTSRRRELIEARNQADQTVYQIEKLLKEHGDKMAAAGQGRRSSRRSRRRSRR